MAKQSEAEKLVARLKANENEPQTVLAQTMATLGLGCRKVGTATGISAATISRVSRGVGDPDLRTARRLCRFFDMTLDELFPEGGPSGG